MRLPHFDALLLPARHSAKPILRVLHTGTDSATARWSLRENMDISGFLWDGNRFLGIEWHLWKVIGWTGNLVFFSRFFVQWIATEKHKKVMVPVSFWWLSLIGSILLLIYGLWQRDSVFIFSYAFTWIPYVRNLIIHARNKAAEKHCHSCGCNARARAKFCDQCGTDLQPRGVDSPAEVAYPGARARAWA